jgi:hypothetical protein
VLICFAKNPARGKFPSRSTRKLTNLVAFFSCMALKLQYQDRTAGSTSRQRQEDNLSLDVSIVTPETALNISQLVMPPIGQYLGDLGTTQETIVSNVDLENNILRQLANTYLVGLNLGAQRREEAEALFNSTLARKDEDAAMGLWTTLFGVQEAGASFDSTLASKKEDAAMGQRAESLGVAA